MAAYVGIFFSALLGSGVAALGDLMQKKSAGAVVTLQTTLADMLGLRLETLWAVLILMIVGAGLCFVFQPKTRQSGFALGLSVISVLMTATPSTEQTSPAGLGAGHASLPMVYALLPGQAGIANDAPILRVQAQAGLVRLSFEVNASGPQAPPLGRVTIRARELPNGQVWQWTTDQFARQTSFPVQFFYDAPVAHGVAAIEARLEAENYTAAVVRGTVTPGTNQIKLSYTLEKSTLPGVVKQLFERRGF